jgi:fructose-specific phosphotransferase system component IIB
MKTPYYIFYIICVLILHTACGTKPDILEGKWERFDDHAAGAMVKVEQKGDVLQGMLFQATGELANLGFVAKDIKWKDIKRKENNYYIGFDLQKSINANGEVVKSEYIEAQFKLVSDDILEIAAFSNNADIFGTTQKWKRIE